MSKIAKAAIRSAIFICASLALGPHIAAAQDQSSSQACKQEQLAGKKGDEAKTKSEVLAKCDSVIRPPQVGDQEMVEPALPVGRTPIIKPEQNR
ncbi:hypothetical protein N7E02_05620 (plasmid) [Aliirhizobium terrae]|uniref:hypothetical protein n=1 Tax=Terrirhizobium terrae TaxID=2926709 RepID=UPI002575D710|nr:hypothetical protein [Rhizobium sp. CC-CFT758]WJH38816.1 hypothetical protein N7E02_05620 [Rhizobium sp. CC-CFT758]